MSEDLISCLAKFAKDNRFVGTGPLSVAIVVTEKAKSTGLPLDPSQLLSKKSAGQVAGLSSSAVQKILKRHGIDRVLSKEGGRTSRGSISKMKSYVAWLNENIKNGPVEMASVENFWIERVKAFFAGKPFKLRVDHSLGIRMVVRHILAQAKTRQSESTGTNYVGAVMQHLVGAKLDCALGVGLLEHHSFSTSDDQSGRSGDFLIGETALHVTTAPSEGLIQKCRTNLENGLRPVIITSHRGTTTIDQLAEIQGIGERIDIFEFEQFIALNLFELGRFAHAGNRVAIDQIVLRYNQIVGEVETDPSLCIEQ